MDYKVEDCFLEIRNGISIKQGIVAGGFPITRIETLADDKFNRDRMGYAGITEIDKYSDYVLEDGDLLMSHINSPKYLGRTVVYHKYEGEVFIHGMNLLKLRTNIDILGPDFAEYLFASLGFRRQISKIMKKSVNQASFSVSDLRKISVKIPSLSKQREIINKLHRVKQIANDRNIQLEMFDELIKSRFVEMFGDPITNPMKWNCMVVTDICDEIYGGGTPSTSHPEYFEGNIPWVSPKDMKTDVIIDSIDHITEEAVKNSSAKMVPVNSVLMVIRSGILKHTLPVAINRVPVAVNQDMKVFIPSNQVTSQFLSFLFKMIARDVLSGVRSVTADNIDFNSFKKRSLPVPPIDLQNQFASFVQVIDKLKFGVQKSLDETQELFDSLMQMYFE